MIQDEQQLLLKEKEEYSSMVRNISIRMNLIAPFGADCLLIIFLYLLQSTLLLQEFFSSTVTIFITFIVLFVILILVSLLLPKDIENEGIESQ